MQLPERTITKRLNAVFNDLENSFQFQYCDTDVERILQALKRSWKRSDRPSKLRKLYSLLDYYHIDYERGKKYDYYEKIVQGSIQNAIFPSYQEIKNRTMNLLLSMYQSYPTPEEYMKRIVDQCCTAADGWENDTLRVRILKQFIKYGDYLSGAGFGGKRMISSLVEEICKYKPKLDDVLTYIKDNIFDCLSTAQSDDKKPAGKYGLLKVADDLAAGKFRTGGATKKNLYLFAMAYKMTYHTDHDQIDEKTDIEINLFRDYYANNLMRFITDDYNGRLDEYELDPSGQGINYKNFAEIVYLYYISQDLSSQDKIKKSTGHL